MKIYPLYHGVSFHPSVSSFFFPKGERCYELTASSHETAACTRDTISYAPAVMVFACSLLHCQLHNVCHYNYNEQIDFDVF